MKIDSAPPSATSPAADAVAAVDQAVEGAAEPPDACAPLPAVPSPRPVPFAPRTRRMLLLVGGVLGFLFLLRVGGVLTPFLWAIVVSYIFNPFVTAVCRRTRLPRGAVVGGSYLLVIACLAVVLNLAVPRLNEQLTQFSTDLPTITSDLQARYFGSTSQPLIIVGFNIDVPQVTRQVASSLNAALNNLVGGTFTAVVVSIERLTQFLLFLIVTFYLLLDAPRIGAYFARAIPRRHRDEVLEVSRQVDTCLSQYLRAQLILIAIMSTAAFIVLTVMGVRFAIVLAPLAGVLEIFPIIGPFAAITLVTLVAIFSPPHFGLTHTTSALIVALTFFILRQIEDYAVIPNVVGHAVRLHPALILFAVAVGATFGGALGLFLAVPATGALKVLGTYLYQKLEIA